jgi:hypothetical protein
MADGKKHVYERKKLLIILIGCFLWQVTASAEVFGVSPHSTVPPALATNFAQHFLLPSATHLRLGMKTEEAFAVCPGLDRKGLSGFDGRDHGQDFGKEYFLRWLTVVAAKGRVIEISFRGGFPNPNRETVITTAEWLLTVFGPPDTAFDRMDIDAGRFGLIWKRNDLAIACWFATSDSGKSFYAYLTLVPPTKDMEKILRSRGGHMLPKTSQAILARLKIWSEVVARLEPDKTGSPALKASDASPSTSP